MKYVGLQLISGKQVGREKMGSEGETSEKKKINGERIHVLIKGITDSTPNNYCFYVQKHKSD